jgi:pre-mRNA-splicing factor CDC5/CEF1
VLREMTPLLGKELQELHEGTGFEGATPRLAKLATPNTMVATPMTQSTISTPQRTPSVASGRKTVPVRDSFGLNEAADPDSFSVSEFGSVSSRAEKLREKQMKAQLTAQLKGLPEPEYTYDISIPAAPIDEESFSQGGAVEDATEVEDRLRQQRLESERLEAARRSTVLRRGLPRPYAHPTNAARHLLDDPALQTASALVNLEASRLIARDNQSFPDASLPAVRSDADMELDRFEDELLLTAREAIAAELQEGGGEYCIACCLYIYTVYVYVTVSLLDEMFDAQWDAAFRGIKYVPSKSGSGGVFKQPTGDAEVGTVGSTDCEPTYCTNVVLLIVNLCSGEQSCSLEGEIREGV